MNICKDMIIRINNNIKNELDINIKNSLENNLDLKTSLEKIVNKNDNKYKIIKENNNYINNNFLINLYNLIFNIIKEIYNNNKNNKKWKKENTSFLILYNKNINKFEKINYNNNKDIIIKI